MFHIFYLKFRCTSSCGTVAKFSSIVLFYKLCNSFYSNYLTTTLYDKGNNKITELRTILQRESQNS